MFNVAALITMALTGFTQVLVKKPGYSLVWCEKQYKGVIFLRQQVSHVHIINTNWAVQWITNDY